MDDDKRIVNYMQALAVVAFEQGKYIIPVDPAVFKNVFKNYIHQLPHSARHCDEKLSALGVENVISYYNGINNPVVYIPFNGGAKGLKEVLDLEVLLDSTLK